MAHQKSSIKKAPQDKDLETFFFLDPSDRKDFFQSHSDLTNNRQFMARCIENDWRCFDYASERLKTKKEFLLEHLPKISKDKWGLSYVWERIPEKLKTDNDFLFDLVIQGDTKGLFNLAPESFKENEDILLKMIPIDGISILSILGEDHKLLKSFSFAKKCVSVKYASILWFQTNKIRDSPELLLAGLKENQTRTWQIFTITDELREEYKQEIMTTKEPSFFQQALIKTLKTEPWLLKRIYLDLEVSGKTVLQDVKRFLVSQDYENAFKIIDEKQSNKYVVTVIDPDTLDAILSKVRTPLLKIASTRKDVNEDFRNYYKEELSKRKLLDIKHGGSIKASKAIKIERANKPRSRRFFGKL